LRGIRHLRCELPLPLLHALFKFRVHLVKLVIYISIHQLDEALCLLVPLLDQCFVPIKV
jgi:hypothetical protein